MRIIKPLGLAFIATLAFMAIAAANSFAAEGLELFLTASGLTLLFTGHGKDPILRAKQAGLPAEILCELVLIHGFILHKSPLAHLLGLLFEGKCVQRINGGAAETCKEHITTVPILAELGLLLLPNGNKDVVISLQPREGTEFVTVECGGHVTKVGGQIIGEIPTNNANGEKQIETARTSLEIRFETKAKNNEQKYTEIFLLGELMKKELKVEGFLGEGASEEATSTLQSNGLVTICIHTP